MEILQCRNMYLTNCFRGIYSSHRRTRCYCIWTFVIIISFLLVYKINEIFLLNTISVKFAESRQIFSPTSFTYENSSLLTLLINTTNCKIPEFPAWSASAKVLLEKQCTDFFKGPPNCIQKHRNSWTYMNESFLHVNLTAVEESGFSWNSIMCCYREIIRVEQTLEKNDQWADKSVRYSDRCYPITSPVQEINAEFIRLTCISTQWPMFLDAVSRKFFAIPRGNKQALAKVQRMVNDNNHTQEEMTVKPNVIILGLDTMSRLNSQRNFKKTLELLDSIGAVEMKGFTKVGENTFPNNIAFLTGYPSWQLRQHCYQNGSMQQDYCPYVWKAFSKSGYLTATMEDASFGTFMRMGFVHKPTDFYFRPLMQATYDHVMKRPYYWYFRCLGGRQMEQVVLDYLEDILRLAKHKVPLFAHIWLTSMAHECSTTPQYSDDILYDSILRVLSVYKNTILFFIGDHGQKHGEFRQTIQGRYEDNLPLCWVYLPKELRQQYPSWWNSLKVNSNRLASHFDIYKTLVHILKMVDNTTTSQFANTQVGQSLFTELPENRSCNDAGVPEGYCSCYPPEDLEVDNPVVIKATQLALQNISNTLPMDVCDHPVLESIESAQRLVNSGGPDVYTVRFFTNPGHFLFEATVKEQRDGKGSELVLTNQVLRLSTMKFKPNCVSDSLLEKYCYCK